MKFDDIEPLEPGHWLRSLRQLAVRPIGSEAELERALRHAFHLVQLAPRPLRHIVHCTGSEEEFEALLEAGAFEGAALRLLGTRTLYRLTKSSHGREITAEVWHPDHRDRHSATERSPALALLQAWLECNSAIGSLDEPGQMARVVTFSPGEPSTEH